MKMHRLLLLTACLVIVTTTIIGSSSASGLNPPDEVDESELEEVARPIRASANNGGSSSLRKRGRGRGRKNGEGGERVLKRRLPTSATFRPTRAPLFEASPPDPFLEQGEVGPTAEAHYGHSHSPPTADPYYSPSRYEREKKRHKIKLAGERHNSFDQGPTVESLEYQKPGKNYAFAYAVGEEDEDFSHKQTKDGSVTVGEYRITLPDGRTQVVRYTAGQKSGYKADVTYERPEHLKSISPTASVGISHNGQDHGQFHTSVRPTHHLSATPAPSFQNNRVYKSRPLKNVALHSNEGEIEYSPNSDDLNFHPTPKIRSKGSHVNSRVPLGPTPTTAQYLNGVSSTPSTPRPNSIYDKISPYRGGAVKYSGSDELAHAHEQSPRAGPVRAKKQQYLPKVTSTAAAFFYPPSATPVTHLKASRAPTKKYKDPSAYYSPGGHQPQENHVKEYVRPQKVVQYLQENPIHHDHHVQQHHTPLIAKPIQDHSHHVSSLGHQYNAGPVRGNSYSTLISKPKKAKKNKHHHHHQRLHQQHHQQHHHQQHQELHEQHHHQQHQQHLQHGIHQPLGQYLQQSPVSVHSITPTPQVPTNQINSFQSTPASPGGIPQLPFHYYNSLHHGHPSQLSPSPTPVTSVTHHDTPFPLTSFSSGGSNLNHHHQQNHLAPTPTGQGYLETPPSGERPNRLGVKEVLSRLPSHDLATPKTTVHPYEVGAVDYGKSVAYGLHKPLDSKGFPEAHYGTGFPSAGGNLQGFDHLDSFGTSGGSLNSGHRNVGYFPNDVGEHFNFLDGLSGFDVEQANVREIRQPNGRGRGRPSRRQRRPDKRQGVPAASDEDEAPKPSPTPSRPRNRSSTSSKPKPTQSTTQRNRGRRRRTKTQQPDPMMHAVETRRNNRSRSRNTNSST